MWLKRYWNKEAKIKVKHSFTSNLTLIFIILIAGISCSKDSNPAGPTEGLPFAVQVISANIGCEGINLYTNPEASLWAPDLKDMPNGRYSGFVSLGPGGSIILRMGVDVVDGPGPDIRVYQAVSDEEVAVYVSPDGDTFKLTPLGSQSCPGQCDFDLNGSGLTRIRFVKVEDREFSTCYETPGADIDAVEALNYK